MVPEAPRVHFQYGTQRVFRASMPFTLTVVSPSGDPSVGLDARPSLPTRLSITHSPRVQAFASLTRQCWGNVRHLRGRGLQVHSGPLSQSIRAFSQGEWRTLSARSRWSVNNQIPIASYHSGHLGCEGEAGEATAATSVPLTCQVKTSHGGNLLALSSWKRAGRISYDGRVGWDVA